MSYIRYTNIHKFAAVTSWHDSGAWIDVTTPVWRPSIRKNFFVTLGHSPVTAPLKRYPAKVKCWLAKKICFPTKLESWHFPHLASAVIHLNFCFHVKDCIYKLLSQIIADKFLTLSQYFQSPLKMYNFMMSQSQFWLLIYKAFANVINFCS